MKLFEMLILSIRCHHYMQCHHHTLSQLYIPCHYYSLQEDAVSCDPADCTGSECRCSSTSTPGDLEPKDIPHFVVLSFDDNVNVLNYPLYEELSKYKNPNGCNIKMTFFVSHESNDYTLANKLHRSGHEIAVHSIT